jgi:hypothetical protein
MLLTGSLIFFSFFSVLGYAAGLLLGQLGGSLALGPTPSCTAACYLLLEKKGCSNELKI